MLALVLPREAAALPDIGLAFASSVLPRTVLEAVPATCRIGVGRHRLAERAARGDEV